tara:strand:+ start:1156 stop:1395 length:240 start_codon:yes stop_codon:yes gene_type:complete
MAYNTLFDQAQSKAAAFGANLIVHSEISRLLSIADDYLTQSLDESVSDDDRAALQSASWTASQQVADLGTVFADGGVSA